MNMIYNNFSSLERKNRFDPKLWEVKRTFSSEKVHFISPTSYSDAALMLLSEDTKRVLFVLLHDILYTTGGTHAPSETTINWASSGAKWRTQYYAPTISVQVVVFYNTKMSQISSPFF